MAASPINGRFSKNMLVGESWMFKNMIFKWTYFHTVEPSLQCQKPGDREESVCCFFSQFREATGSLSASHIIDFHIAGTSTLLRVTLPPPNGKGLVYNVSVSELAVQPVLWAEKAGVALKENMQKWDFKNAVFSGKAFYLNPFRWWALSHEIGNHFLVNEVPQMEYGHAATHSGWHLWTEVAFLNVYIEFYWVHVLWVKQSLSGRDDCLSEGHLSCFVVWKWKCVWRRR